MTGTGQTYGRRINELAADDPERVALVFAPHDGPVERYSMAELDSRSDQVARALAARGVGIDDRVGLEMANSPALLVSVLASWKLGASPVPLRWDLPPWERNRLLDVLGARLVISGDDPALADTGRSSPAEPLPDVLGHHAHGICSSGSTGSPKVIMAERPAFYDPAASAPLAALWGTVASPQVVLVPAPLYHTNGFATLLHLLAGDSLVLLERFDAGRVLDLIEAHRVTSFTATPTMLARIARTPGVTERDLSSIDWVLQGGAVIAQSLVRTWIELVGPTHLIMAYGMTEALGLTGIRGDEWLERPGSVGRGIRGTEVRVLGADSTPVPTGEIGEIYLRMPGGASYSYIGGAARLPTTDDGFSTGGDLGWLDDEGFLYIADRRVDMIVSGGANVYPAEVESALIDHPAVVDVVVIGLRDDEWGRRVHALVQPADPATPPSLADIVEFAKLRLAPYKVPKSIEVVASMPRTEATKINRSALVTERGG